MRAQKLAINGGEPVSESVISFHEPDLGDRELSSVGEVLESGWVAGPGPACERVEDELEDRWSVPRVLTTSSCTHALELALLRLDLDPTDEVVVPSYTYVSTALSVLRAGGKPVFADVKPDTLTLDPESLASATSRRTTAVIYVHYGGYPGPIEPVVDYCYTEELDLIEDAAQAFDTRRKDRPAGTFGRFGAFSFHGTKSITCGEGGALLLNDEDDVSHCEMIRDKGTDRSQYLQGDVDRYTWRSIGSSYVMSDIQGAVLESQLERWPRIKSSRLDIQRELRDHLRSVDTEDSWSLVEPREDSGVDENGHLTAFKVREVEDASDVLEALQAENIQARSHYQPLHQSPFARKHLDVDVSLPIAEQSARQLIRLPTHTRINDHELECMKEGIRKVYRGVMRS